MANYKCTDEEFLEACREERSAVEVAKRLGMTERAIYYRRKNLEIKNQEVLPLDARHLGPQRRLAAGQQRKSISLKNGVIVVGSDAHYWPEIHSTAQRALVFLMKELQPEIFVLNGDSFDGPTASRFGQINWEEQPSIKEELEAVKFHLGNIKDASPKTKKIHIWGNHDSRFDTTLSSKVSQFEGVPGFSLVDHLPDWEFHWSLMVNENTMIKHRWHGGVHAAYNNVMKSGMSMVTGHLHALQVKPWTDYRGTRYATDTGTLADPTGPQFKYAEDNPCNHRSGFAVLTFEDGFLMPPELVQVVDEDKGEVFFRGRKFNV